PIYFHTRGAEDREKNKKETSASAVNCDLSPQPVHTPVFKFASQQFPLWRFAAAAGDEVGRQRTGMVSSDDNLL
ncbi:MAG: hypothetical protein JXB30_10790, partial [Anaerolineae bacterium]|nr:hypothetical protein [Anaerolineae bacterium]